VEIIELLSDDDTPPAGDASNPIVLDSDDEADRRVPSVHPLPEASQFTPRPRNIHPDPPSGSNHLARSHTLQSSSPDTSNTGDEFCDAESSSVQRASLPPPSEHSIQAVDQPSVVNGKTYQTPSPIQAVGQPYVVTGKTYQTPSPIQAVYQPSVVIGKTYQTPSPIQVVDQSSVVNGKTYQTPSPIRDSSEIQDNMPNGVSENTREASSPVATSPSPMNLKSRDMEISDRLAISRISSSPNQNHLPPVDASTNSSFVPVRGTLYSGRSGLWKGFFRITTAGPASPSKPSRDIDVEEEGDARSKEAPTSPRVHSPCKFTPTTLVSLAQNMSIRSSPTPPSVDGRDLEISDDPTITTLESDSSAVIGELSR
jgi:hypothetical protein